MLQFVHSTVSRQPRIKHCVLLSSAPKVSFEVLLVYEKYADIIYAEVKDASYDFKTIQTFSIETPLRWIDICNEHIFSFTETNKLLLLNDCNFTHSPSRIASLDFSFFLDPSGQLENFQFFCFSKSKNFLLISSVSNHFFIVNISDLLNTEMKPFYFEEDFTIIDVSISNDQDCFIFLVEINEENMNNGDQAESENKNPTENEIQKEEHQSESQSKEETENLAANNQDDENDDNENEKSEGKEEEDIGNDENENDNSENDNDSETDENDSDLDEEESEDEKSKRSKKKKNQAKKSYKNQKRQSQSKKSHQHQSQKNEDNQNKTIRSNQKIIFFDAQSFSIIKTDPVYDDFVGFITPIDTSRSFSLLVKKESIEVNSKCRVHVNSPVRICSKYNLGTFACQLESNDILISGSDSKTTMLISDAPRLDNIWIIQNTVLLLSSQDKNFYIELHKIKRNTNKKGSSSKIQFKNLKAIKEINLNPIPTFSIDPNLPYSNLSNNLSSLFFDKKQSKLLFSTDNGIFHLSNDAHIETGKNKCKVDDIDEIFAPVSDVVIGSNDRETRVIYGEVDITESPTVAVLYFASKHIQVHKDGINEFNDILYECSTSQIKCAASNGIRLVVGHEDGHIILFHSSFNEYDSMDIPRFTNLAICGTHLAVSEPFKISLYNFALEKFSEFELPSYPISMVFINYGRELYASLHCGAIIRISDNSVTYPLYFNKDPKILQTKESESSLFILDEYLYIYSRSRLVKTDLTNISAICSSYDEDEPLILNICFLQNKRLYIIKYDEISTSYSFRQMDFQYPNPKLFEFCDNLYAIINDINEENESETENENENEKEKVKSIIIDFETKETLISFPETITCYTINEEHSYLFIASGNIIYCINYIEDALDIKYKVELEKKPIALGAFYNEISIGFANEIKIADFQENSLKFHNISLELESPIKTIIQNGFCWAILQNSIIFTYIFNDKLDRFEVICHEQFKNMSFSQFCIIDSCTIAAVADLTNIIFIRIQKRLSASSTDKHTFDIIGRFNAFKEIAAIRLVGEAIIYVTVDGSVHSLTCCNQDTRYRIMLANQLKIRNEILNLFAISEPNDDEIWNQYNVVDADVVDTLKNQDHNVKNEQDIMNSILYTERQKIIFK